MMMLQVNNDRYMCPNCHTAEYIREDIDGHHCAMCGIVVCEDVYRNDQSFDPTTHRVQGTFIRSANTHCKTMRRATAETRIRNLAECLRLDKSYETEMIRYMNALFANEATERIWNQGRYGEMVIGVLAFIVCRSKGVAVTFQDICEGLSTREKVSEYELSRVYYRVATVLNTDSPRPIAPSSWVKKAMFKLYSEGACVDDSGPDSDGVFDDDDDDIDLIGGDISNSVSGISSVRTGSLYSPYASLVHKSTSENSVLSARKLKLRMEEKGSLTLMATRILQAATKQWITVGKKPMPIVAAAIALAIEYYHSTDDIMKEVAERLGAAKTTVNKRCSEILRYFSTSLKAMGFKNVRNRKDVIKHIPLALMYFDAVDTEDEKKSTSSSPSARSPSEEEGDDDDDVDNDVNVALTIAKVSRKTLPASFLKSERMRKERSVLIEQCKRLNQAIVDGTPFPDDIAITDESMLVGKLLFEGVPEDVILNCPLETLKNLKTTDSGTSFVPLGNPVSPQSPIPHIGTPRRRVLKRYEKKRRHPVTQVPTSVAQSQKSPGCGDDSNDNRTIVSEEDEKEEEIEDFNWDSEVVNCLREERDRKLVGRVVEEREKQMVAERAKLKREAEKAEKEVAGAVTTTAAQKDSDDAQPKKKKVKVDKRVSTKINRQRLSEFLLNEKQKMFEGVNRDSEEGALDSNDEKSVNSSRGHLLDCSTDSAENGGEEGYCDYDYYPSDTYAADEDLDIHF